MSTIRAQNRVGSGWPSRLARKLLGNRIQIVASGRLTVEPYDENSTPDVGVTCVPDAAEIDSELTNERLTVARQPLVPLLVVPAERLLPGEQSLLEWPGPLYQFQVDGVRTLMASDHLLLADEMGLGKTVQVIAALRVLWHQRRIASILIVTRASLLVQWRRELAKWAPEIPMFVVQGTASDRSWQWRSKPPIKVVSYETLRADPVSSRAPFGAKQWDVVVLDEAQAIKNRETDVARVTKRARRTRSWALSGTPLENKVEDIISVLDFVDAPESRDPSPVPGPSGMRERLERVQLRRRKRDVLKDLPEKHVINVPIELGPRQRVAYDRAEREGLITLKEHGADLKVEHILHLILRLKQLCNFEPVSGESAKVADIKERIQEIVDAKHKTVVFSQFVDERFGVQALARAFAAFNPVLYTGALDMNQRSRALEVFETDPGRPLLLLSLRAGGLGLNLQNASYVFHLDRWWNPAVESQADDRVHRIGQIKDVTVYKYTCLGTIEERIDEIIAAKRALFEQHVDDVSLDLAGRLTEADLRSVVGLSGMTISASLK